MKLFHSVSDQRTCLVLCRHHDGHPAHAGDVGSSTCRGGQWWWGGGGLRLAVDLRPPLDLGQKGVALWSREGAPIGGGVRRIGLPLRQTSAIVVAVVGGCWGGGSEVVVMGGLVSCCASCGSDDGGVV